MHRRYRGGVEPLRLPRTSTRLPRRGHALVKIALVDESGFTYDYDVIEAPIGAVRDSIAAISLQAVEPEAAAATKKSRRRRA